MKKITYLDGLRRFAALQVVLVHYLSVFLPSEHCSTFWFCWQQTLRENYLFFPVDGLMAVSLFFILSGFVLTKSFAKTPKKPFQNILKRWTRLQVPIFFALLLALILVSIFDDIHIEAIKLNNSMNYAHQFWAIPSTFQSFFEEAFWVSLIAGYENSSVFLSFGNNFFSSAQTLNPALWSLSIEFWGSMLIILFTYLRSNILAHRIAIIFCFLLFPMHNLILFVLGHLLAFKTNREEKPRPLPKIITRNFLGISLVVLGILISTWREDIVPEILFLALNNLSFFPAQSPFHFTGMIAAVFIFLGVFTAPWFHALFNMKVFQKLGRISFALFLLHFPILLTVTAFLQVSLQKLFGYPIATLFAFIFGLMVTFIIAQLFTKWIDKPAIKLSQLVDGRKEQKKRRSIKQ